jgi:hypothetical protein
MSNVADWPPRHFMLSARRQGKTLARMIEAERQAAIDLMISQPHWRPQPTLLAVTIRLVIKGARNGYIP